MIGIVIQDGAKLLVEMNGLKNKMPTVLRDGPLGKLLGGMGNFRHAGIFFRYQIPCINFLGHSMNIF